MTTAAPAPTASSTPPPAASPGPPRPKRKRRRRRTRGRLHGPKGAGARRKAGEVGRRTSENRGERRRVAGGGCGAGIGGSPYKLVQMSAPPAPPPWGCGAFWRVGGGGRVGGGAAGGTQGRGQAGGLAGAGPSSVAIMKKTPVNKGRNRDYLTTKTTRPFPVHGITRQYHRGRFLRGRCRGNPCLYWLKKKLAEREGFEPSVPVVTSTTV